jgi:hypothetical protein
MVIVSAASILVGGFVGILQPQPGGGNTLELNATTGSVASVTVSGSTAVLGSAPAGSVSDKELCYVDGQFLLFRPGGVPVWFKLTADGVVPGL